MANSKFEYVKKFELEDRITPFNWIVVRIDGCNFHRFSMEHQSEKPNDESELNLMNACAVSMLERFPDIVFAYGVSDEYSFIWKDSTEFYQRRESKLLSLSVSFFTSVYVKKLKELSPQKELNDELYFDGCVFCIPKVRNVRDYLAWRQSDYHTNNQYKICSWMLVKSGKTEREAQEALKGTHEEKINEILFKEFGVNYDKLSDMIRKGSSVYREKVEEVVKYDVHGLPVLRTRNKVIVRHCDLVDADFWDQHSHILKE